MDNEVKYLLSLQAVRDRSRLVGEAAKAGKLNHFDVHEDKLDEVVDFVTKVIERDFGPDRYHEIPPHGRWQHFEVGGQPRIKSLTDQWRKDGSDDLEITRRLIDLFFVSVLLDAGAGDHWRYTEPGTNDIYERSEGIAVASLHMFTSLLFTKSGTGGVPQVEGKALETLTDNDLAEGFHVTDTNPMSGIGSRAALCRSLGKSLLAHPKVFGAEGRPGNLVDCLLKQAGDSGDLDVLFLWDTLQSLLIPIWPQDRTVVNGMPIGDAWPLSTLESKDAKSPADSIQPFHKLTQWLTYSLMVPFQRVLGRKWVNAGSLTALPEYRNGGLFVDLGVLTLKEKTLQRGLQASGGELPQFDAGDDAVVEWRAMTLVLIDKLHPVVEARMGLSMAQLLEAGTWKSGREVAAKRRPATKSSPILIRSDGTVF